MTTALSQSPQDQAVRAWLNEAAAQQEETQIELYCEHFPTRPEVVNYLADRSNPITRNALMYSTRELRRMIPLQDYFDAYGLTDGFLLRELKDTISRKGTDIEKGLAQRALEFAVKWKHAIKNAPPKPPKKAERQARETLTRRLSARAS